MYFFQILPKFCLILVGGVSTQKLYLITVSYFQGKSTLHGAWTMLGYVDIVTFSLETMTFTLNIFSSPLFRNYKWQLFHIFRAFEAAMRPVCYKDILDPLTLT